VSASASSCAHGSCQHSTIKSLRKGVGEGVVAGPLLDEEEPDEEEAHELDDEA
jgi:hypothetical protein